jgi:pimeloyl-ACP methyl ester carboxylesterase
MLAAILLLAAAVDPSDCRIGAYRLDDGSVVTIDPSQDELRWHKLDGTLGVLHQSAGGRAFTSTLGFTGRDDGKTVTFDGCQTIVFDKIAGHRIDFDIGDTTFKSGALELAGRLVLPKGGGAVPIVVLVHGSENYSGRDRYLLQRMLPAEGVGVFVYDKRGTGKSQGEYSQDFSLLADDAAAAVREARRLAGKRAGRVGFHGGSQGGYVAPLAATRTQVDFVSVGFGLAVSPLEEDRQEIVLEMKLKHHTQAEIDKALQVAAAAATILTSGFTKGFDELDAVRNKYRGESWYKDLHGNFTVDFLPLTAAELRARSKELLVGTPMSYDAMPVLRRLKTPQLWELGALDLAAPSAETARRLKSLKGQVTVAMFPKAEHGIYEFEEGPYGERVQLRNSDGYFALIRDFARDGRLRGVYGDSVISGPAK